MKRIIIPEKICGFKISEHCYQRMRERNIHPEIIEEILTKRVRVIVKKYKKCKLFPLKTKRGYVTLLTDLNEKTVKTLWVN